MTHKTDGATVTTIFQNRKEPTQQWTLVMNEDEITATASKKISGAKVGKLFYKNGKWTTNGAQDAKNFLRDKQNFANLNKEADTALDLFEDPTDIDYTPSTNNKSKSQGGTNTSGGSDKEDQTGTPFSLGNVKPNIPKDPEGFFIARYPISQKDTGNFDFLKVTCYDYEPSIDLTDSKIPDSNLFKLKDIDRRIKKRRGVISLPMQPNISESNSVDWGNNELNPIQIAAGQAAGKAMTELSNALTGQGFDTAGIMNTVGKTGGALASSVGQDAIKAFFAGQAIGANILTRGTGLTINNNLEVLFNGPQLRTFTYNYRFTPREPKEADKVKQIIRFFKKQMAPKRSTSRIFLKTPNVWKLKYTYKNGEPHPFLNNIKICALNNFSVDYTPDGSYSTYEDDGGRGDGSMTSYQVGMSFLEMTPIFNDDFWNDDEGKEGTGF